MPADIRLTMFLPPDDTLRVWELRGDLRPSVRWHEMMHEDHATAFTVAKVAKLDTLRSIRQSLDTALREGRTFEAWKSDLVPELKKAGWWGTVADRDITGTDEPVIINERRLQTIFRTNVKMSQAAGAWAKIQREKEGFPYLRYRSDHFRKDPRADHRSWHGLILPVDHPWWLAHFPPNGWGCGCRTQQITEGRMRREGWTVSEPPNDGPDRLFYAAGRSAPLRVPAGIAPGFGYNPGTAHLRAVAAKVNASVDAAVAAGLTVPARRMVEELVADPAFNQFRALPDMPFPVQILDLEQARALGSTGQIVRLSLDTLTKQEEKRANVTDAEYRYIPNMLMKPDLIEPQKNRRTAFYSEIDGRWYRAAVKTTHVGDELFLLHFQYLRNEEMARIRQKRPMLAGWLALYAEGSGAR